MDAITVIAASAGHCDNICAHFTFYSHRDTFEDCIHGPTSCNTVRLWPVLRIDRHRDATHPLDSASGAASEDMGVCTLGWEARNFTTNGTSTATTPSSGDLIIATKDGLVLDEDVVMIPLLLIRTNSRVSQQGASSSLGFPGSIERLQAESFLSSIPTPALPQDTDSLCHCPTPLPKTSSLVSEFIKQ